MMLKANTALIRFNLGDGRQGHRRAHRNSSKFVKWPKKNIRRLTIRYQIALFCCFVFALGRFNNTNYNQFTQYIKENNIPTSITLAASYAKIEDTSITFPPWLNKYIQFHNSAIEGGHLKDGFRYLVYECTGEERCGGAGDSVMGIVKALYWAMCTNRVLLVDAPYPIPIDRILNPNFMVWNSTFPKTIHRKHIHYDSPIDQYDDLPGYRIIRTNGPETYRLSEILENEIMIKYLKSNGWSSYIGSQELSVANFFHKAFWALFKFDNTVLSRAEEMKMESKMPRNLSGKDLLPYIGLHQHEGDAAILKPDQPTGFLWALFKFDNTVLSRPEEMKMESKMPRNLSGKELLPYIGLHQREGDAAILKPDQPTRADFPRSVSRNVTIECYQRIKNTFYPDNGELRASAYVASDSSEIKKQMNKKDLSIHFHKDLLIYHIDKSDPKKKEKNDDQQILKGVIDAMAEVVILVDATCLVMSKSMFSFLAYYIRGAENRCNVFVGLCDQSAVNRQYNTYPYEYGDKFVYESHSQQAKEKKTELERATALLRAFGRTEVKIQQDTR